MQTTKVLQLANVRLAQIEKLTRDYADDELEKIYLKEHMERRKLIKPVEPTWEKQLEEWMAREYKGKD